MITENTTVEKTVETRAAKFHRLATKRLQKALKDISLLENLSSAQYEKTEAQVEYINDQLSSAVCSLYDKLNRVKDDKTIAVELPI